MSILSTALLSLILKYVWNKRAGGAAGGAAFS